MTNSENYDGLEKKKLYLPNKEKLNLINKGLYYFVYKDRVKPKQIIAYLGKDKGKLSNVVYGKKDMPSVITNAKNFCIAHEGIGRTKTYYMDYKAFIKYNMLEDYKRIAKKNIPKESDQLFNIISKDLGEFVELYKTQLFGPEVFQELFDKYGYISPQGLLNLALAYLLGAIEEYATEEHLPNNELGYYSNSEHFQISTIHTIICKILLDKNNKKEIMFLSEDEEYYNDLCNCEMQTYKKIVSNFRKIINDLKKNERLKFENLNDRLTKYFHYKLNYYIQYYSRNINLNTLKEEFFLSRSQFNAFFSTLPNYTFKKDLDQIRLEHKKLDHTKIIIGTTLEYSILISEDLIAIINLFK